MSFMKSNKIRIGLTGSKTFENKNKIKDFIFRLREQTDREVVIVGLGEKNGADKYVKRYALEFGYQYQEANLQHTPVNLYSMMGESYHGKPFTPKNFHIRNKIFAGYVDSCVVFDDTNGTDKIVSSVIAQLNKVKKRVVMIS